MSVSGNYIGHYSWGCGSNYGQFNITFNPNGTFGGSGFNRMGRSHRRDSGRGAACTDQAITRSLWQSDLVFPA